jgi:uncharacterized protein YceK
MKIRASLLSVAVLAGCATVGTQNEFTGPGVGTVAAGVDCVADEVMEEGWTVVSRDDDGMMRAEMGGDWIQANVIPAQGGLSAANHQIRLTTADSPVARDAASEVIGSCT